MEPGYYVQMKHPHPAVWVTVAQNSGPMTEEEALDLRDRWVEESPDLEYRVIKVEVVER